MEVTEALLLEYSGEAAVEHIRELVLRGMGIDEMSPPMRVSRSTARTTCGLVALFPHAPPRRAASPVFPQRLVRLELLSLSHNKLKDLSSLESMLSLTDLNLNSNHLTSLAPVAHCRALRRLFVSGNKIASLLPLRHCTDLETLAAASNMVASLGDAIATLSSLPRLRSLELAGNPCALGEPYRHELLSALPDLSDLDGDGVVALDRELAADWVGRQQGGRPLWER